MAKKASPWYWEARNGWYVLLNGQRHFLGEHPQGVTRPQKSKKTGKWNSPPEIDEAFRNLLNTGSPRQGPADEEAVANILDDFITWSVENRARVTAARYGEFCQDFVNAKADEKGLKFGQLNVSCLTGKHVTQWLNNHPTWGPTTKRNAITALIRGFSWAVKNRGLARNPIAGMEKPEARRRKDIITPEEFETILELVCRQFADLITVSYDCGARPFEVKDLEARHCQLAEQRAVIPADEAKGRQRTRVFYLPTERTMAIVSRLCHQHPTGPIFRNNKGNRWTGDAVKCQFENLEIEFGLREMERQGLQIDLREETITTFAKTLVATKTDRKTGKPVAKQPWELHKEARQKLIAQAAKQYGKRFNHYAFRRTFITRKIVAGVDSHIVATLAGHESTAMIDRHYSAVAKDHGFLLRQAKREVNPGEDGAGP